MAERAIGVFDSGIGGLTVFRELRRWLPGEELVYLGDTARVPYGTKSAPTVCRYAIEAANFLLQQQVKLIVVACNTASAVALDLLAGQFDVPIVGVIEPGSRRALEVSRHGRIGVIGTEGTIRSQAYERVIRAGRADVSVTVAACPLFVPLAEEGWADHPIAAMAAREYLGPLLEQKIDTLVLGCTHYPLLKETLQKTIGDGVTLIDSAEETAKTVAALLKQKNLRRGKPSQAAPRYFVTDIPDRFRKVGGTFLGDSLEEVSTVSID
ncbi:MAG TPA: glutamate racemase [Desulfuromonadales bacterium]|nr:glutamate racemase [Desulfuromonadales bacterium]